MFMTLAREAARARLRAAGFVQRPDYNPGSECWGNRYGREFGLNTEANGDYEEVMIEEAERAADWRG